MVWATIGDPDGTRTLTSLIALLAAIGIALLMIAVWLYRTTRPDPELLAPLEAMGERKWRRADPVWQRRRLDELRPDGAEPLEPSAAPPELDESFDAGPTVSGFDDLRRPVDVPDAAASVELDVAEEEIAEEEIAEEEIAEEGIAEEEIVEEGTVEEGIVDDADVVADGDVVADPAVVAGAGTVVAGAIVALPAPDASETADAVAAAPVAPAPPDRAGDPVHASRSDGPDLPAPPVERDGVTDGGASPDHDRMIDGHPVTGDDPVIGDDRATGDGPAADGGVASIDDESSDDRVAAEARRPTSAPWRLADTLDQLDRSRRLRRPAQLPLFPGEPADPATGDPPAAD